MPRDFNPEASLSSSVTVLRNGRLLYRTEALPNLATLFLRSHHRIASLALKRAGKFLNVRQRSVYAKTRHRVFVALSDQPFILRRRLLSPHLCPTQKETLFRCEPINVRRSWLALH